MNMNDFTAGGLRFLPQAPAEGLAVPSEFAVKPVQ